MAVTSRSVVRESVLGNARLFGSISSGCLESDSRKSAASVGKSLRFSVTTAWASGTAELGIAESERSSKFGVFGGGVRDLAHGLEHLVTRDRGGAL